MARDKLPECYPGAGERLCRVRQLGSALRTDSVMVSFSLSRWASLTVVNGPGEKSPKHAGPDTAGPIGKKIWDVALDGRLIGAWQDDENRVLSCFFGLRASKSDACLA